MPDTWNDLRERYALTSADFLALVGQMNEQEAIQPDVCGDWSTKDIVAHLAAWLWEGERRFRNHFMENGRQMSAIGDGVDAFNARAVAERRDHSWQETLDELRRADMTFAASAAQMTARETDADPRYIEWVTALADDYRDHGEQVRAWREKMR